MSARAAISGGITTAAAAERIAAFRQRYGEGHMQLACHAAIPLALTPDLLYRLWAAFGAPHGAPWIAVADLLLSSLCEPVSHELFVMPPPVRTILTRELRRATSRERLAQVAEFLVAYVAQDVESPDPDAQTTALAQHVIATAYLNPAESARLLALMLQRAGEQPGPEHERVAALIELSAEQLRSHPQLLAYARGVAALARGDEGRAHEQLTNLEGGKIDIGGVVLRAPEIGAASEAASDPVTRDGQTEPSEASTNTAPPPRSSVPAVGPDRWEFGIDIRSTADTYEVVARSDEGEVRETFQLALSDADRTAAGKLTGGGISATMRRIGRSLFDALFVGAVRGRYGASRTAARNAGKALRIRLLVQPPELAAIPWELLYDPDKGEHICLMRDLPFVRTAPAAHPIQALAAGAPLKVLAMAASPNGMVSIGIEAERARLEQSLAPLIASKRVALTWVEGQTWRALQTALQGGPWHIFHFLGHGGYDAAAQEGFIALADEQSDMVPLGEAQISRLLANSGSLRLVVLAACGEADGGDEPFAGIASTLIRRGLPAALAMQRPISTEAAPELTRSFYGALAQGLGVDQALVEARVAISVIPNSAEWSVPVLFSRATDGVLFEITERPGAPPTPGAIQLPDLHTDFVLLGMGATVADALELLPTDREQRARSYVVLPADDGRYRVLRWDEVERAARAATAQ